MLQFILIVLSFFSALKFIPSFDSGGEIRWNSERKLTIDDFKGIPPHNTLWAAETSSQIYLSYTLDSHKKLVAISVYASFLPDKSWIKTKTEAILGHEQLHFDIAELAARKLYDDLNVLKDSETTTDAEVKEIYVMANNDLSDRQTKYDAETNHGIDSLPQAQWKIKIEEELRTVNSIPE